MKSSIGTTFAWELHSLDSYLIPDLVPRDSSLSGSLRLLGRLCFLNTMAGFFLALVKQLGY